jgi:hypothetical protein
MNLNKKFNLLFRKKMNFNFNLENNWIRVKIKIPTFMRYKSIKSPIFAFSKLFIKIKTWIIIFLLFNLLLTMIFQLIYNNFSNLIKFVKSFSL